MSKLSRYILGEMIPWLLIGLTGAVFLFVSTQLIRVASLLAGTGAPLSALASALLWLLVPVCGWSLTPAFAVSAFATFGRMSRDGELLALDAAGVPRRAILLGPALLAVVLAAASAAIWLEAGPRAQAHLRARVVELARQAVVGRIAAGRFMSPIPGTTFYADAKLDDCTFGGVLVESAVDGGHAIQVSARKARLERAEGRATAVIRFEDGTAFIEEQSPRITPLETALSFDEMSLSLSLDALSDRLDFLPKTMALSTEELLLPPPKGTPKSEWSYALLRRVAAPVGAFSFSIFSLLMAAGSRWRSRGSAVALAGGAYLAYHLLDRLGESLTTSSMLSPAAGAFMPAALVLAFVPLLCFFPVRLKSIARPLRQSTRRPGGRL